MAPSRPTAGSTRTSDKQTHDGARDDRDGRVRRGARNRERITEALFELIESGELLPTAEQVAQRAGVGERTVFRHFSDMETLFAELSGRVERELQPLINQPPISGNRSTRVRSLVARRSKLYQRIAPFKYSAALQRRHSPFLQRQHETMNRMLREHLVDTFGEELHDRDSAVLDSIDLVCSFEAWDRLHTDQQLSRDHIARVLEALILKLLTR